MKRVAGVAITLLFAATVTGTVAGIATDAGTNETGAPGIERVYPNPVASGDVGEYVVLSVPGDTPVANATLSDGTERVSLANVSRGGPVAISPDPGAASNLTDVPVANVSGLALANGGERLTLRVDGAVTSRVRYTDAPEGEIGVHENGRLRWRPLGATDFDVARGSPDTVQAFVLPDNPEVPAEFLRDADERLLVGGYTLSSERVATALIDASERGVDVRVLLEGKPVGGRTRAEAAQLDRLAAAGIDVRVIAGDHARVEYHHAKYAVTDDRALVTTENWKPAGTGGNGSRGWGVVTAQPAIVDNLTAAFRADAGWRDAVPWDRFRRGRTFERGERAVGQYPTNFEPRTLAVNRTELLLTPDGGGDRLVGLVDDADESIGVVQASLGDWGDRLPAALRRAAQRDVDVRILLSSAWYSEEENRATVDRYREWADRAGASLEIKLATPNGRFEKIHAKGAIVDGDRVVVGSLNWNDAAMTSNREVVLVLHGSAAAEYYRAVFDADWTSGTGWSLPLGLLFAIAGCLLLAGAVLAKIRFENRGGPAGVGPPGGGQ